MVVAMLAGTGAERVVPLSKSPVEKVRAVCFVAIEFVNVEF